MILSIVSVDTTSYGSHEPLEPSLVGMFMSGVNDDDCILCQQGCCVQRYVFDTYADEPLLIHGCLGES